MATINFPTSLDTSANTNIRPSATDAMNSGTVSGPSVIDKIYTEIEALQGKVGVTGSAVTTSLDYKLSGVTGTDKAMSLTGAEVATNKTFTSPIINNPTWDYWASLPTTNVPTYLSATSLTNPVGIDWTIYLQIGDKIKFTQTTTKYFIVIAVSSTVLTVTGGTDYIVTTPTAISSFRYSKASNPQGFPQWINYTPTPTGFSAVPANAVYRFRVANGSCDLQVTQATNGTSNATTFTLPLPITCKAVANFRVNVPAIVVDNATVATGHIIISSTDSSATIYKSLYGAWTNSGGKAADFTVSYPI